jgi:ferritin-like metal-binding protein YciE
LSKQIENRLQTQQKQIKQLEEIYKKLGTEADNHKFREQIKSKLQEAASSV